jgi:hypothetical protein
MTTRTAIVDEALRTALRRDVGPSVIDLLLDIRNAIQAVDELDEIQRIARNS